MAISPESLGVFVGPTSADEEVFAAAYPKAVVEPAIFDEATCGTTAEETIPELTPVGVITASGVDTNGRLTIGVHDPAATDGRQDIYGFLVHKIYEANGARAVPVDCPCNTAVGGALKRSRIPAGSMTAAKEIDLRKNNSSLRLVKEVD